LVVFLKNLTTLFKTFFALGHGEQAIIVVPDSKLVFVMTAGNYMQVEQRPFEIMALFILPSLKVVNNITQSKLTGFTGEYQINRGFCGFPAFWKNPLLVVPGYAHLPASKLLYRDSKAVP
jgi:hypothetical protein